MASLDETPILEAGATPVPGGDPCGIDAGDDEQYIFVTAEISKLDRIEGGDIDWWRMEQEGLGLIRNTSKDVEIAGILGVALFQQYGYAGLAAGLGLIHGLCATFWDGLFPPRPRRRKARIEALTIRFTDGGWFGENQPAGDDFDALDRCIERTNALNTLLTEKFPDDPPDFKKFLAGLKGHAGKRPVAAAPAPAAEGTPTAPGAVPGAAPAAAFSGGNVEDVPGARKAILNAATFIRKADPTDPIPYAVARFMKWSKIGLPTSDAAKTQIDPPEQTTVDTLEHQFANRQWENLLKNAEGAFRSSDPLWLDLQRYVCSAMVGLGPPYENARQAVMVVTATLVRRLGDGLFELSFRNGNPLCSGETKMWIEAEVAPPASSGGGGGGGAMANGRLSEASNKARKLAGEGKLSDAMSELQRGMAECSQRRDRFMWKASIAQLCYDAKKIAVAASLSQECQDEIRRYHIDEWEPSLAVEVAQILYRSRKALIAGEKEPTPEALQSVRESFAWLCQLDPSAALAAE
jgi:type VI secretion system protein VasJ